MSEQQKFTTFLCPTQPQTAKIADRLIKKMFCETKAKLTIHNDKSWYSPQMCLNRNHKKDILEEFEELKTDGFTVHRAVLDKYWLQI